MRMVRQLGREDWILAGLAALAEGGPGALRIETVARGLGVSKGSFYWHFRDRAAWRDALLAYWEHLAFLDLVRRLRPARCTSGCGEDPPAGRPDAMVAARSVWPAAGIAAALPAAEGTEGTASRETLVPFLARLDRAFRLWAEEDTRVARTLSRIRSERATVPGAPRPQPCPAA